MQKIIIFTSAGGGGHLTVTKALLELLEKDYTVVPVHIFTQVLRSLDPSNLLSKGNYSGEHLYNTLIRNKRFFALNMIAKLGFWYYSFRHKKVVALIKKYLQQEKPDLIISVIPFINAQILMAAQQTNIPLILMPTDLDATTFVLGIDKPIYKKFICTPIFNDRYVLETFKSANLTPRQWCVTGLPLRHNFYMQKNKETIKENWQIPHEKPVILLLMGAAGSCDIKRFTQELYKLSSSCHVLVCIGRDETIRKELDIMHTPEHITSTIVGFTQDIADLISVADIMVSKSGSVSVCEALFLNIPLILDATSSLLKWEQLNHRFIVEHKIGLSLTQLSELTHTIDRLLQSKTELAGMKKNLQALHKPDSRILIPQLIQKMLKI